MERLNATFLGALASAILLPLLAYATIERPAPSFSARWAVGVVFLGCLVIMAQGWVRARRSIADVRSEFAGIGLIGLLNVIGLVVAYATENWWMAALAGFTSLIALVIARPEVS